MSDQNRYDEFHQNIGEFWTYIGKSKYKKKKSAAVKRRAATNEAAKALSTASTIVVAVVVAMVLYVTCLPVNIQPHSADIHVQLYDWVDEEVYYALRQVDGDMLTTVEDGLLQEEKQLLHFENLQDNQSYLLEFFTLQKDGQPRQVGRYEFKTTPREKPDPTVVAISGKAELDGRPMNPGEFSFVLTQDGQTVQTATNDLSGSFVFTLPFEAPGTYTYTVSQVAGTAPGVTYDNATFDITVTVADVNGQLQANVEAGEIQFANTYVPASGEATFSGNVSLTGRPMNPGEFSFVLTQDGQAVQTITNDSDGNFAFTLSFETTGTYSYAISQVMGTAPRVTYDNAVYEITVTVTDVNGQLQATVEAGEIKFANTYVPAPTEATISGNVSLTGRPMSTGEFSFVLTQNGQAVQTVISDPNGKLSFTLPFEAPGTYTYTVSQIVGTAPGVTYDTATFDITIVITDVNGQLQAAVEAGEIKFANTYVPAPSEATVSGSVSLTGRTMNAGEFSFVLAQNGQTVYTVANDLNGSFFFTLPFSAVGTYTYTLQQTKGTAPGVTYDAATFDITVVVTDVNGQLQATVEAGEIKFANTYVPAPTEATISGSVSLTGRTMNAGEFSFVLMQNGQAVQTVTNDANGGFSFTLPFSAVGTYTYTLQQTKGTAPGVTYDAATFDITVVVTDVNGQLQAAVEAGEIKFANTYVPAPTEATVSGSVSLTGRTMNAGEFSFVLMQNGQAVQTVTNDANGGFSFTLPFSAVGTYTYTLQQTQGTAPGVTYDAATFDITVVVTDVNGQLQAAVEAGEIKFANTYVPAPTEATVSGSVSLTGRTMSASEFGFVLTQNGQEVQTATNDTNGGFSFTLPFSAAGTYTYTLQQTKGTAPGVTYDTITYDITVTVTDVNGQLQAAVEVGEIKFANTYVPAPTEATISGSVSLTGRTMNAGEFSFVLMQNGQAVQTVTNNANGGFSLTLPFSAVGSYTYTLQQTQGTAPGVTYDTATFNITVIVTDVNGQLQATVEVGEIKFANTYVPAPTEATISGIVSLTGRTMSAGEFSIKLSQNGQTVQTVTNNANGGFSFKLTFDKAGSYTYTIQQVQGSAPAVTYDTGVYDVIIEVTDIGGQLQATVNARNTQINNTYTPTPVSTTFSGSIRLSGRTMLANEFTFAVANGSQVIQTVTNDANGGFTFNLTFTAAGTYTYTVYQVAGSDAQITYDTSTFTQTYTVTDNNGVLSLQEDTTRAIFSNIHTPAPIAVNIDGIVTLDGATLTAGQFTFVLQEGNTTLGQTTNAADGSIRFTQTLSAAGTYTYTITQQAIPNPEMGLLQDLDSIQVIVTVTDQNGQLSATQEYSRQEKPVYTLEFWNVYEDLFASALVYGYVSIQDTTSNSIMPTTAGRFNFGLYQDGKLVSQIANDEQGSFYFPELVFRKVGTYNYTVRQIPGSESWIQYDAKEYSVVITVTFEYGDPMAVMDMYDSSGQYMQVLDFINNYTPPSQRYTFSVPDAPSSGFTVYVMDVTGAKVQSQVLQPGMVVEFYVDGPATTVEINLRVTCNIPGVTITEVYRYGNQFQFRLIMPAQDVLPENIILTIEQVA